MEVVHVHTRETATSLGTGLVDVTEELMDGHDTRPNIRGKTRLDLDRATRRLDADFLPLFDSERLCVLGIQHRPIAAQFLGERLDVVCPTVVARQATRSGDQRIGVLGRGSG